MTSSIPGLLASPELVRLAKMAAALKHLDRHWQNAVPPELQHHSTVIGLKAGTLMVTARSAAVVAKLRQWEQRLVVQLNKNGLEVNAIRLRLQVETLPFERPKRQVNLRLSPAALTALSSGVQDLPETVAKEALLRLLAKRNA